MWNIVETHLKYRRNTSHSVFEAELLLLQHDLEVKQLQDTIAELVARYDEQIAFLTEENRTLSNLVAELQARVDELTRALKASELRVRLRSCLFSQLSDFQRAYRNSQHALFSCLCLCCPGCSCCVTSLRIGVVVSRLGGPIGVPPAKDRKVEGGYCCDATLCEGRFMPALLALLLTPVWFTASAYWVRGCPWPGVQVAGCLRSAPYAAAGAEEGR